MQNLSPKEFPQLSRCSTCSVRNHSVCGALSNEELVQLNDIAIRRKLSKGQMIFSDDSPSEFFANIVSGVVKLTKTSADGRQQIVGLLFAPDFLGRAFSKRNPYFAEAATDIEICCFPHDRFERVLRRSTDLEHRLLEVTLTELDSAREWMFLLGRKNAEEKIASFLILVARRAAMIGCQHDPADRDQQPVFELPLSRSDIADYLGLTIETVSRQLTRLKKQGVIALPETRMVQLLDMGGLKAIAGAEHE